MNPRLFPHVLKGVVTVDFWTLNIFRSNVRPPTFHTSSGLKESPRRVVQHDGFSGEHGTHVPHPWDEDVYFLPTIMNNHKNSSIHVGKHSQAASPMDGMGISQSLFFPMKIIPQSFPFQTLSRNIFPDASHNRWPDPWCLFFFFCGAMIKEMNSRVVASGFISVILATLLPLFFGPKRVVQNSHSSLPAICCDRDLFLGWLHSWEN